MINRELPIFLFVGMLTVLFDLAIYTALVHFFSLDINVAKAAGFLAGTLFAYLANRFWTFGHEAHRSGSGARFAVLYTATLICNISVNALTLKLFFFNNFNVQLAFILATGVSAVLNFFGMKYFVFKNNPLKSSR